MHGFKSWVGWVLLCSQVNIFRYTYIALGFIEQNLPRFRLQRSSQFQRAWRAQDGALPHRRRVVTEHFAELFGDRVIALNHQVEWPPQSPNLTPFDFFFLWGHMKSNVFTSPPPPPADINELQRKFMAEVNILRQDRPLIRRAVNAMLRKAAVCIQRDGGHVEDLV